MSTSDDLSRMDLRLLALFELLYDHQSVTRAAEQLAQSQPTVSIWLNKMRVQFADPLFVRVGGRMVPTLRAEGLIARIRQIMVLYREITTETNVFEPALAKRTFRVCMTDASHITVLPQLLSHLRQLAPGIVLEIAPIDLNTASLLQEGEADLALGLVPGLESGFYQQRLYEQDFVCLINAEHPRVGARLTLKRYLGEQHIEVVYGRGHSLLAHALQEQQIERVVVLRLPGFLGLSALMPTSELVATIPRMIGETLARDARLRLLPCPFNPPVFTVKQYWHARSNEDPGHRWLRARCSELFAR